MATKTVKTKRPLYQEIADLCQAIRNCAGKSGDVAGWESKHRQCLRSLIHDYLPHGSGIDAGVTIDPLECKPNKLVFSFSYHHMNENGMYDGWTDHSLVVTPAFDGIDLRISGRNRNGIKDYLYDIFDSALRQDVEIE